MGYALFESVATARDPASAQRRLARTALPAVQYALVPVDGDAPRRALPRGERRGLPPQPPGAHRITLPPPLSTQYTFVRRRAMLIGVLWPVAQRRGVTPPATGTRHDGAVAEFVQ